MKIGDRVRFKLPMGTENPHGWTCPLMAFEPDGTLTATVEADVYRDNYSRKRVTWLPIKFDKGTRAYDYFGPNSVLFAEDFEVVQPSFDIVVSFPSVEDAIAAAEHIAPILNQPVQTIRRY